jgi:5-methylcytosine-specific restriction endonuclease McrA
VPWFTLGRTNAERPGVYLVYCATLDHVIPHQAGGRTDADNLVTSCWPCNYGKYKYSLEQLGMDSPFDYPPVDDAVWAETVRLLARS